MVVNSPKTITQISEAVVNDPVSIASTVVLSSWSEVDVQMREWNSKNAVDGMPRLEWSSTRYFLHPTEIVEKGAKTFSDVA